MLKPEVGPFSGARSSDRVFGPMQPASMSSTTSAGGWKRWYAAHGSLGELAASIERIARVDAHVALVAPRGAPVESIARELHARSRRSGNVFVVADAGDCGELVAKARRGVLFVNRVAKCSRETQDTLAPALADRESAPRVIAAHEPNELETSCFRADLAYALNGASLRVPALAARRDEVVELARSVLERLGDTRELSRAAAQSLRDYAWPGDVRELELVLERASLIAGGACIEAHDLALNAPAPALPAVDGTLSLELVERDAIERALAAHAGNKLRAAKALGIHRATLHQKLRDFGLQRG